MPLLQPVPNHQTHSINNSLHTSRNFSSSPFFFFLIQHPSSCRGVVVSGLLATCGLSQPRRCLSFFSLTLSLLHTYARTHFLAHRSASWSTRLLENVQLWGSGVSSICDLGHKRGRGWSASLRFVYLKREPLLLSLGAVFIHRHRPDMGWHNWTLRMVLSRRVRKFKKEVAGGGGGVLLYAYSVQ